MKAPHSKTESKQTTPQAQIKHDGFFAAALAALLLFVAIAAPAVAVNAVWNPDVNEGGTNIWNDNFNWNGGIAPVNAGDTATFNFESDPFFLSLKLSNNVTINSMTFTALATNSYTISTDGHSFSFVGDGIVNESGVTHTINNNGGTVSFFNSSTAGDVTITNDLGGTTSFFNSSTAGSATIMNINSGSGAGITNFSNTSTAANANITNSGPDTSTNFFDTSTAGNATIQNDSGGITNFLGSSTAGSGTIINTNSGSGAGVTDFRDTSTAGNANITNSGSDTSTNFFDTSTAASATITNDLGGTTSFFNSSTAGSATIINTNSGSGAGMTDFRDTSTAGNANITNSGSDTSTNFFDSSTAGNATITNSGVGSVTQFGDNSTAANAVITNSGAASVTEFFDNSIAGNATITNSGANSRIDFFGSSSGGAAALINANPTAVIDISGLTLAGTTVGSIAGDGSLFLGDKNLTVGGNQTSTVFSGVIQDGGDSGGTGGSLTKVGTGALTLTGANTYTGATTVNGGSLIVDGSISGAQTSVNNGGSLIVNAGGLIGSAQTSVNAGGFLGGTGTIGGNLTNSGIVSPGSPNSTGTLTVAGNYTQTTGGTLRIEIAGLGPTAHDLLAINGTANLSGTLQIVRLNNFKFSPGDQITFLTATSVNGTFNPVINPFVPSGTIVEIQVVNLSNGVSLEAIQGSFLEVPGLTPNQMAVAKAVDSGGPPALISFLDKEPLANLPHDFDLIAPDEVAATFSIGVSLANVQTVNLGRRMEDIRAGSTGFSASGFSIDSRVPDFSSGLAGPTGPEGKSGPSVMQPTPQNRWGVFVTGLGEFTSVDDTSIVPGYNFSTGGLTFGVDYRVCPNFAIGLTGGYAHTNANLVNNGSLDVNGGTIGAYATGFAGGFYVDTAAFGVFNGYDSHRTALLGTASGDTDGQDFNALIEAGYDWKHGGLTIGPLASFQYTYVGLDSFTEHGSLAPLSFSSQNAESTRTALGAKASYDWKVGHIVVKPELRAAWQHEFGDTDYSVVSRFASGTGNSFTVNGPAIGRDSLLIGAGAAVLLNDRFSVYAYYDGELARTNYSSNSVSAGFRVSF